MSGRLPLRSPAATRALGRRLGAALQPGDFVALTGDLGAGKTLLVKARAERAGAEPASSPSFALLNRYGGPVRLQHLDLYRIANQAELFSLGFDDLLEEPAATLCEWADRAPGALPRDRLEVAFEYDGPKARKVRLHATGARAEKLIAAVTPVCCGMPTSITCPHSGPGPAVRAPRARNRHGDEGAALSRSG